MKPEQQTGCSGGYQPPQFDIKFLMLVTAALAIELTLWSVTSTGSKIVLSVVMLTYLFGCKRTRRSVMAVTPPLFLPYLLLMVDWNNYSWHPDRGEWLALLWQLPGVLVDVGMHQIGDLWFDVLTVLGTLGVFFAFVTLGRIKPMLSVVAFFLSLFFTACNSLICAALLAASVQ